MNLSTAWTQNLPEDKREDFEKTVIRSRIVLRRLKEIVEAEIEALNRAEDTDTFSTDWAYHQASRNGQRKTLRKILTILGDP